MARYVGLALLVVWTAASVPVGLAIWPPAMGSPPGRLLPLFVVVMLFEGGAFGLGAAFLVLGGRLLAASGQPARLTTAAYIGIAWLLMNWWPHAGLHRSDFGRTFAGLAAIDVAFHTTLILAAAVVTAFFVRTLRQTTAAPSTTRAVEAG